MPTTPRVLLLDIETAPNTAYVWGLWDQNIAHDHLLETSYILCWAAKWYQHDTITSASVQGHKPGSKHYRLMLRKLWTLLDQADVVIHYYGSKFDTPVVNREFVRYGIPPPSPYKQLDLKFVVAKAFKFESNKLDHVAEKLGYGNKLDTDFSLWVGCMENNPKAWAHMLRYNKHDVRILEQVYTRLLPWIDTHPSYSAFRQIFCCPKCGSMNVQEDKTHLVSSVTYQRYRCLSCYGWFRSNKQVGKKGGRGVNIR